MSQTDLLLLCFNLKLWSIKQDMRGNKAEGDQDGRKCSNADQMTNGQRERRNDAEVYE
jgi:hypothetical protein